jgi:hypothetical protein
MTVKNAIVLAAILGARCRRVAPTALRVLM